MDEREEEGEEEHVEEKQDDVDGGEEDDNGEEEEGEEANASEACAPEPMMSGAGSDDHNEDAPVTSTTRPCDIVAAETRILLNAIDEAVLSSTPLWGQSWTRVAQVLSDPHSTAWRLRDELHVRRPAQQLREFLPPLVEKVRARAHLATYGRGAH